MGEITDIGDFEFVTKLHTWWPSLFPIGPSEESFIPIGQLFQLQHDFLAWLNPIGGSWRNEDIFAQPSNMYSIAFSQRPIGMKLSKKFYTIS